MALEYTSVQYCTLYGHRLALHDEVHSTPQSVYAITTQPLLSLYEIVYNTILGIYSTVFEHSTHLHDEMFQTFSILAYVETKK